MLTDIQQFGNCNVCEDNGFFQHYKSYIRKSEGVHPTDELLNLMALPNKAKINIFQKYTAAVNSEHRLIIRSELVLMVPTLSKDRLLILMAYN